MINIPNFSRIGSPFALVLHDAGAANLVIGWLKLTSMPNIRVHVQGPAEILWRNAFPNFTTVSISDALSDATALLTGTGWASMLEYNAMKEAKKIGMPIYAVVDHWVNYRQRFLRNNVEILPNEIWVSDHYAVLEARKQLPEVVVCEFDNSYLKQQLKAINEIDPIFKKNNSQIINVLYALEPIRQKWPCNDKRPGEFQALDYFISKLNLLGLDNACEIRLRPHPSDPSGKYDSWIIKAKAKTKTLNIYISSDEPIFEAIAWSDMVVGCESFVLIIGLEAGRKIVSTLPPWSHQIRLPHEGILRLNEIKELL